MAREIRFPRINMVMISGYLARDVDLRYTSRGHPVARMTLAFNTAYKNYEGIWVQEAHFLDVKAFGEQAVRCTTKLRKGSPVIVEGSMNTYTYTTKENQQRTVTEISANRVQFLEKQYYGQDEQMSGKDSDDDFGSPSDSADEHLQPSNERDYGNDDFDEPEGITDDDIPF